MAQYKYEAVTDDGQRREGAIDADNPKAARSMLRAQGLVPMALTAASGAKGGWSGKGAFDAAGRAVWTRQLAGLLSSGLNIERALGALIDEMEEPKVSRLSASLMEQVQSGQSFAKALGSHPGAFSDIYVAVVAASEEGGHLGKAMLGLATQLEEGEALKSKLIGASLYPAIVSVLAMAIVVFLVAYVVPQVATVFMHQKKELPLLTRIMLGASAATRDYGLWVGGALIGSLALAQRALRVQSAREAFDAWTLGLPVMGRMARSYNAARYGGTLAMLVGAGVPIVKALAAAADTMSNHAMRKDAREIVSLVREGASLGACLGQKSRFPKLLATFARLGEQTGELPQMLERASRQLGDDVQRKALRMATLLEPLLIVAMGAVVMLIVASVLLPIVNMSSLAK
jgi:general secretion pathway protein F